MVHKLPHKFNRRLSSVLFLLRHVKIVNKSNKSCAKDWTVYSGTTFSHLIIQVVLRLIG
jgi:hypothetical protein